MANGKVLARRDTRSILTSQSSRYQYTFAMRHIIPCFTEHSDYRKYIEGFPEIDSAEIFGLHQNTDFLVQDPRTLGETQPVWKGVHTFHD